MSFENYFPVWNDLNTAQKNLISDSLTARQVKKGTILHNGNLDCTGLLLIKSGQLRTYILSDEGREITLYRLFDIAPDACLTISPFFMTTKVGIVIMPNLPASSGCSSTLILPTLISDRSSAISSMIGTTIRQGAHQGAQKSSRTGLSEFITSF